MEIIYIILIILIFINIYLINNPNKKENFELSENTINTINGRYIEDMNAIKYLSNSIIDIITQNDSFRFPSSKVSTKKLSIKGLFNIKGNLNIKGNINSTKKDTAILDVFPTYMIIAWGSAVIPRGWAICNGYKYLIDPNTGNAIIDENESLESILTPDLRGKMILNSGQQKVNRYFGDQGGEEVHELTQNEIRHHHRFSIDKWDDDTCTQGYGFDHGSGQASNEYYGEMTFQGGDENKKTTPHNNMPPYYVLYYIMKI
jgi:microcystin-dependent protein